MKLSDQEIELFELAYTLGIPISHLYNDMSYEELLGWSEYFKRRPLEWRADYRASVVAQSFGGEADMEKIFPSLKVIFEKEDRGIQGLKGSVLFSKILGAVGGDKIPE